MTDLYSANCQRCWSESLGEGKETEKGKGSRNLNRFCCALMCTVDCGIMFQMAGAAEALTGNHGDQKTELNAYLL